VFEDALLESGGRLKTHRAATTFASLLMQSALVGLLLLMPLIFVDALPRLDFTKPLELPPSVPAPRGPERVMEIVNDGGSEIDHQGRLITPHEFPDRARVITDERPPGEGVGRETGAPDWGIIGGLDRDPNGVLRDIMSDTVRQAPPPPPPPVARSSVFMQGLLIHRVVPPYPEVPKRIRLEGAVVMHAVISREGTIQKLQVISGHPMLRQAALDAVSQWRYRPYVLNGQPVEVETQITFNFVLKKD
jgi:periplasmic protein TonB